MNTVDKMFSTGGIETAQSPLLPFHRPSTHPHLIRLAASAGLPVCAAPQSAGLRVVVLWRIIEGPTKNACRVVGEGGDK